MSQLREVGFTDELLAKGVAALSGGWKMKLALVRAMLQKADILLLDEPTNHLDVHNVAWLQVRICVLHMRLSILVDWRLAHVFVRGGPRGCGHGNEERVDG